jgi:hypothetical protein
MQEGQAEEVRTPCPWCKHAPGCPESPQFKGTEQEPCDFRALPFEEKAVTQKALQEIRDIKALQEQLAKLSSETEEHAKLARKIIDKTEGIRIMAKVLHEEFHSDELSKEVLSSMTFMEKIRLAMKLQELKKRRKAK